MAYDARTVANEILKLAKRDGLAVTNMQLQKLPYFCHGWCVAMLDEPLIDETPQAWQYGPVYPSIYDALKIYGSGPVTNLIPHVTSTDKIGENFKKVINSVWSVYRKYTAYELSAMTHQPGTPWSKARENGIEQISHKDIKEHFNALKRAGEVSK